MYRRFLSPSFIVLLSSVPSAAWAGGYYVSDVGARGMARGGAFVAAPDSLVALNYNPAGLSLLRGFHVEGDVNMVSYELQFQRTCPCLIDPSVDFARENQTRLQAGFDDYGPNVDDTGLQPIPFIGIGYGFDWQKLTLAFGVWGPPSPKEIRFGPTDFANAQNSPARYSMTELSLFEAYYSLGVALEAFEGFRVGGSAMIWQFGTTQSVHQYANTAFADPETAAENPIWDIPTSLDFAQNFAMNWSLGLSYSMPFIPGLSVGASVFGKRSVRAAGTADINIPDGFSGNLGAEIMVDGDEVELALDLPPIWRFGVQYQLPKAFTAELSLVHEAWKVHEGITVTPKNINVSIDGPTGPLPAQALGPILQARNFVSTTAIRVGGELHFLEPYLGIMAGYFYEPSAVTDAYLDPSTPDFDKHGFSFGLNTTWSGFRLDVGAQYIVQQTRTITDTERTIEGLLEGDLANNDYLTRIGNGEYSSSIFIFGGALSFALDGLMGDEGEQ